MFKFAACIINCTDDIKYKMIHNLDPTRCGKGQSRGVDFCETPYESGH